jgi:hypothetical protein
MDMALGLEAPRMSRGPARSHLDGPCAVEPRSAAHIWTERQRSRTCLAWGCQAVLALKQFGLLVSSPQPSQFGGNATTPPVIEPGSRCLLSRQDERSQHFEVVLDRASHFQARASRDTRKIATSS